MGKTYRITCCLFWLESSRGRLKARHPMLQWICMDAADLSFADSFFDVVLEKGRPYWASKVGNMP